MYDHMVMELPPEHCTFSIADCITLLILSCVYIDIPTYFIHFAFRCIFSKESAMDSMLLVTVLSAYVLVMMSS